MQPRIWTAVEQLVRDVRIGARMLLKTPLFTIFASLVLSIGIGSNVMVFTYLNALFLRPLDVPEPAQLMRIYGDGEGPNGVVTYDTYLQYRDRNQSFANIGMSVAGGPPIPIRMKGPGTLPIDIMQPTTTNAGSFETIRLKPRVGRNIESGDERLGAPNVAMINEAAWKQYFAEDRAVVGRTIFINNAQHTVIGVVTESFERVLQTFPGASSPKIYLPQRDLERRSNLPTFLVARLKPDVSREQAQADLSRVAGQVSLEKRFHIAASVRRI